MLDTQKLSLIIDEYKKVFPARWQKIQKKWKAPNKFLAYWNINDRDFAGMVQYATLQARSVINKYNAPLNRLQEFIEFDAETVRDMFKVLYDERIDCNDLIYRINYFISGSRALRDRMKQDDHYQSLKVVSTYLYLRYPNKYYIYNYEDVKLLYSYLCEGDQLQKGVTSSVVKAYNFLNNVAKYVKQDQEFRSMLDNVLTQDCYQDTDMKILTEDIAEFYHEQQRKF